RAALAAVAPTGCSSDHDTRLNAMSTISPASRTPTAEMAPQTTGLDSARGCSARASRDAEGEDSAVTPEASQSPADRPSDHAVRAGGAWFVTRRRHARGVRGPSGRSGTIHACAR